ncbi:MAG: LCP family protein [bacterium]
MENSAQTHNIEKFSSRKGMKESPIMHVTKKKKNGFLKIFLILTTFLLAIAGGYIWYLNANYSSTDALSGVKQLFGNCEGDGCIVQIDAPKETCLFPPFCNPELPATNGRTNVLVVGIDTRDNNATQNTDTIMMISYDHNDKNAYMISIPRDTYVSFKNYFGNKETSKINAVYYLTGMIKKDQEKAMLGLSNVVGDITGLKPHYTVLVTLQGFKDAIDTLGGVTIDVPADYTDAYPKVELSPALQKTCKVVRLDGEYCKFSFTKGVQILNGEMALVYARSREFSSDYDRARRQQLVITSLKNQVLSTETLTNPQKILELITTFKDSIKTSNYDLGDIIAGLNEIKLMSKTISIVLDPLFGGGGVVTSGTSEAGYISQFKDSSYKQVQSELQKIFNYPNVYTENPKIGVYIATTNKKFDKNYSTLITNLKLPKYSLGSKNTIINQSKDVSYTVTKEVETESISTSSTNSSSKSTSSASSSKTTAQVTTTMPKLNGAFVIDYTNGEKTGSLSMLLKEFPELQIDPSLTFKRRNSEDFGIIVFDSLPTSSSSSNSSSN